MSDDRRQRLEARIEARRAQKRESAVGFDGQLTLMLVDDEPPNLEALERLLKRSFEIAMFTSGETALEAINDGLEPDIVLSDQRMPGMTGVELLGHVRERLPLSMRLILSGYTDRGDLLAAINTGNVDQYITKPWQASELTGMLQEAVQGYQERREKQKQLEREQRDARAAEVLAATRRKQAVLATLALVAAVLGLSWSLLREPFDEDEYLLIARRAIDRDWVAQIPDAALQMTNPEARTDASVAIGKETYESGCVGCHAADARGGGAIARLFTIPAGALYEAGSLTLPEGAFVWVVSNGIDGTAMKPMGSLVGDNYWHLANYLLSLADAGSGASAPSSEPPASPPQ